MLIQRALAPHLKKLFHQYPLLTVTGPRQSGKTTLCKNLFPDKPYVSLENLDVRRRATNDPNGFLKEFKKGAILDEIQKTPDLFSYLQTHVDEIGKEGLFVLTGSAQFELLAKVSQSLAGRTALATLLPFSFSEAYPSPKKALLNNILYTGFYPRIFDKGLNPTEAMASYCATYIERDVRSLINVKDLATFDTFLKLCANRTGQLVNFSDLANDAGINHKTASHWISVLQTSYLVYLLRPHFNNLNKRLVKTPKLYFLDTGLASYLTQIESPAHMNHHSLKGPIFESFVLGELLKQRFNNIKQSNLYFWRDNTGREIDIIMDYGNALLPIEIKSGQTVTDDYFRNLNFYRKINSACKKAAIIYGGDKSFVEGNTWVVSYKDINLFSKLDHRLNLALPRS